MKKYRAGVVGATGMVGQRFVTLLKDHPWFDIAALAASSRSAGKTYAEAVAGRWAMTEALPDDIGNMPVLDASNIEDIAQRADLVFCAVDMEKSAIRALEEAYAKAEVPVISNNSAHRWTEDVPMILPEVNAGHMDIIPAQRARLGTKRGFIAVKPNCSIQGYVPALSPLLDFGVEAVSVCTYQAISGAGKTFKSWPEMVDNVIPLIGGEEEKSEKEPLRIWGAVDGGRVVPATQPVISAQCVRVPVTDGHMAAVSVRFARKPSKEEILDRWANYAGIPQQKKLPSAPGHFLHYFTEDDRPQTRLDRDLDKGMAITLGRLREDSLYDYKFISLAHNTLRGAAGGGVLMAELLCDAGYI